MPYKFRKNALHANFVALGLATAMVMATSAHAANPRWVGSWGAAQQAADASRAIAPEDLQDATLRQVVRVTVGGDRIRVRLSNAFGAQPLRIVSARVALSAQPFSARIVAASDRPLLFGGSAEVTIPPGADYWSDPVPLKTPALASLAISLRFLGAPSIQTTHPGSRTVSYLLPGDHLSDEDMGDAKAIERWHQISGVDVAADAGGVIVALGDSITDGNGVRPGAYSRWTDVLAERLQASPTTRAMAVINAGIGGNRVLNNGIGPNAVARFERDVLSQSNVTHLIILEGVNDLGGLTRAQPAPPEAHADMVSNIIGAYRQMIGRARARGIRAIGATITPYGTSGYYHPGPENEADREAINAWIRAPGNFDAVIDWDRALRDPNNPTALRPDYSADGLHPSLAGYKAMADAIPLSLFETK